MIFVSNVRDLLAASPIIQEHVGSRINGYTTTERSDTSDTFVVIRPVDVPLPVKGVSDNFLAEEHLIQIDVEGPNPNTVKTVQNEIRSIMHSSDLFQLSGGLDEFFDATKRYVDSRRYQGVPKGLYYKQKLI